MFDIGSTELLLIVIVAVVVIGPKDLPRALYKVGQIVGKARAMARHFRTGIDAMVREVELQELEKKWAEQNKRIMAEHPPEAVSETATGSGTGAGSETGAAEGDLPSAFPGMESPVDLAETPMTPLPASTSPASSKSVSPKSDEAA